MSVAVAKSFTALHLYPEAPVTEFQFQVTWVEVAKFVPLAGEEGKEIVLAVSDMEAEFQQAL